MENSNNIEQKTTNLNLAKSKCDTLAPPVLSFANTAVSFFPMQNTAIKTDSYAQDNSQVTLVHNKFELLSTIETISANFLKLITGQYKLMMNEEDEELELTYQISDSEKITIIVSDLPKFYRKMARVILGESCSAVEIINYFIKQNYNWNQKGKFNETLMHYLITLPKSIEVFQSEQKEDLEALIDDNCDRQGYTPLAALTYLYVNDINNRELFNSLKATFTIIDDYDNFYEDSSSHNLDTEKIIHTAFNILLYNRDNAFKVNNLEISRNYLEILALMCQHTEEPEANEKVVEGSLKEYAENVSYLTIFQQYCKQYEEKDRPSDSSLSNEENTPSMGIKM